MGKYSNINVKSLKNAVSTALEEIVNYDLSEVKKNLANRETLTSSASKVVSDALEKIISSSSKNGSIKKLKNKLNKLSIAADYIKKYQEAETEITSLESRLYVEKIENETKINPYGKEYIETNIIWVKDLEVQNRINVLKSNLESYERTIDSKLN